MHCIRVINHTLWQTKRAVQVTDDTSDTVNNWRPPECKSSLAILRAREPVQKIKDVYLCMRHI